MMSLPVMDSTSPWAVPPSIQYLSPDSTSPLDSTSPTGQHPPHKARPPGQHLPSPGQQAGGTHPTGILSCIVKYFFRIPIDTNIWTIIRTKMQIDSNLFIHIFLHNQGSNLKFDHLHI